VLADIEILTAIAYVAAIIGGAFVSGEIDPRP
jgi:hypothetical protein